MQLATSADKTLDLDRGSIVVCVPVDRADAQALASVRSVLEHTEALTPVILAGPSASLEQITEALDVEAGDRVILVVSEPGTEVAALNAAIRASFPSDVALVVPGISVTSGWLERLRAAATSDSTVASATPLSLGVGALELDPSDNAVRRVPRDAGEASMERQPETAGVVEEAARRIGQEALALHPRIATIGPACAYIRRTALDLAGPLDEPQDLNEALADLAVRTTALGMIHVAADDVLVEGSPTRHGLPKGSGAPSDRVGYVQETIANDERGTLRRSIDRARMALGSRLSVTIDGRALNASVGGTQTYIIELILALARGRGVAVRVLVPPDLSKRATDAFDAAGDIELLSYDQAIDGTPLTNVVHRPQQIFTPDDLGLLRLVGERVVIGQQDLIAYHNYSYHPNIDSWRGYRRTTRLALAGADQVVFFSEHARNDALAEGLLPTGRTHVVGIAPGAMEPASTPEEPPKGLSEDGPFLLCLGADYAHKNRPFSIELLGALRDLGWRGRLVLAGTHVPHGSSREREQELLRESPDLAGSIVDLGQVDEPCRRWLYTHTSALIYPTTYEGFGLLPFEAAQSGLPCLFAAQASLAELAGDAATLVPWDARASAAAVLPLLSDGPARDHHVSQLRALSIPSADDVAQQLIAVYEQALSDPPSEAAPRTWQELDREQYIVRLDHDIGDLKRIAQEYQDAYHALKDRVKVGLPLIDNGGLLTLAQQRGLMRVAARGRLGTLVVAPLGLLGRRRSDEMRPTLQRRPLGFGDDGPMPSVAGPMLADLRPADIEAVFQEFLGRVASQEEVATWMQVRSLRAFLDGVLASEEYARRLATRTSEAEQSGKTFLNCWIAGWERFARPLGELSPDGVVIVGKSGHLLIHGGSNHNLAVQRGEVEMAAGWLQEWHGIVTERLDHARSAGRRLTCLVVPEKLAVYADCFPGTLTPIRPRPVLCLLDKGQLPLVYPLQALRDARKDGDTYLLTDSHLTPRGNRLLAEATLRELGVSPALLDQVEETPSPHLASGDLGLHFDPPVVEVMRPLAGASRATVISDNWGEISSVGGHIGTVRVFRRDDAPDLRTVVIFGDSYAFGADAYQGLSWFLAQVFCEVHFIWAPFGWDPDYLDSVGAELVVCQTAERFVGRIPKPRIDARSLSRVTLDRHRALTDEHIFED